jgi:hypothetical protein
LFFGQGGFLDHQDTVANITLFANEVMPRLRELNPEPTKTAVAADRALYSAASLIIWDRLLSSP